MVSAGVTVKASGTDVLTVASTGISITGTLSVTSDVAVATNKFTVAAATGNTLVAGTLDVTSNVAVATDKFTVTASNGNTAIAGDVAVATDKFTVAAATGNTLVAGILSVTSNVAVATNKFTVAAATGNTLVAGTLDVTSNVAVNTNKFTVAAATGNTLVAGTLDVTSNVAVATNKFTVTALNGNTAIAGTLEVTGQITATGGILINGDSSLLQGKTLTLNGALRAGTTATFSNIKTVPASSSYSLAIGYAPTSDRTLKTSIVPLKNSLQRLQKIKGTTFYWIKDKMSYLEKGRDFDKFKRRKLGFMAQNVKDVVPEAVSYNTDKVTNKKHFGIDYKAFIPLLIEAIKEINKKTERNNKDYDSLKQETSTLKQETIRLQQENEQLNSKFSKLEILVIKLQEELKDEKKRTK